MIKAIDKKYCIENLVQHTLCTDSCHFIVSTDEIILLKIGDKVLINKYANNPNKNLFSYCEKEQNNTNHFTELFEYNKTYLNFKSSFSGFSFHQVYFFKSIEKTLYLNESLPVVDRNTVKDFIELNRKELEELFDSSNYDSMYVIDRDGKISFARNNKDKIHIGERIIPNDNEIVEMELRRRKENYNIARAINRKIDTPEKYKKVNTPKTIDEIKNFRIYGPYLFTNYSHMLLTVKDGKFDLKWFRIDFIKKDKFGLTTSSIPIVEPTIDDILSYIEKYDIDYVQESYQPQKSFREVHIKENKTIDVNSTLDLIDSQEQAKTEPINNKEKCLKKSLIKLFKKIN